MMIKLTLFITLMVSSSIANAVTLNGTSGPDVVKPWEGTIGLSTEASDNIYGKGGNDILWGGGGDDLIKGGSGNDQLDGGTGDDYMFGEKNDDWMHGRDGNDRMKGGRGNDILHGGNGDDELHGGDGNDALYGEAGNDVFYPGDGEDVLVQGYAAKKRHFFDIIDTGSGNNIVFMRGNTRVDSGHGNDTFVVRHHGNLGKGKNGGITITDSGGSNTLIFEDLDRDSVLIETETDRTVFKDLEGTEIVVILKAVPVVILGNEPVEDDGDIFIVVFSEI